MTGGGNGWHLAALVAGMIVGVCLHAGQSGEALDRCRGELRAARVTVPCGEAEGRWRSAVRANEECASTLHGVIWQQRGCAALLNLEVVK